MIGDEIDDRKEMGYIEFLRSTEKPNAKAKEVRSNNAQNLSILTKFVKF